MRTPSNTWFLRPTHEISIGSSISARLNGATSTYKQIVAMSVAIATSTCQQIKYYLNNGINLRPLTPHIMPGYTHKMAIVSWL